ncbi:MAG: biotin/lipoyl-containing protein [Acetivibrionales bacterium]|jgi:biotin carboxyl carrier protein|nr:biotin/lipoyl-binding protein [Bacillota bacterium]NLP06739.1 biotin/lipoyl-binding protein [Clostridiaceae bacterium]HOA54039.1 biotin/lipoyl-binding protein [Clostridiales bacterium]HPZ05486.1 biotin/lipoyl-binding protein [Clostridiales bacterium]HQD30225.1 biotin/lipoyl-binding protein [Clostridiales bacterium]
MKYIVTINNIEYEVEVDHGKVGVISTREVSGAATVSTAAPASSAAEVKPQPSEQAQATPSQPASANLSGGEAIKAPMPGTILDIKVNVGEAVKRGQVILILEAMKMENEIVAPADGTVAQIQAAKGSSVNAGDVLAVLN